MALTVETALKELDVLAEAQVVAGRRGLDRVIGWAHVVDIPDVAAWVRAGDLLLTTAFALKDHPEVQRELVPALAGKGLSGMIVAVGRYMQELPAPMTQAADELSFPLIALPWEVPFVAVIRAIHERILAEQYELVQQSMHIHKVLTQLVLEGQGLQALVTTLATLLDRSVTIEDPSLRLLAHASVGPVDELRRRCVAEGRTPRELVAHFTAQGLFERLRADPRPQRVAPLPEMGMTLERIIAPILVGSELYGYVWIIATERPLAELDALAIERAATVAALLMSREQAVHAAEQRLKDSLLNDLLDPDTQQAMHDLPVTLRKLGLQGGYQLLALQEPAPEPGGPARLYTFVMDKLRTEGVPATVVERGRRLIVLLGTPDGQRGLQVARHLVNAGVQAGTGLMVGLSQVARQAPQMRECYQEALEALQIGLALAGDRPGVWAFEDLGILHWLRGAPLDGRSADRYQNIVREMARQDAERGIQLVRTLEVYLDHLGNAQEAAQELYIHRNTLRQRLSRIEGDWDLDLHDPLTFLNLLVAIKDWRLHADHQQPEA